MVTHLNARTRRGVAAIARSLAFSLAAALAMPAGAAALPQRVVAVADLDLGTAADVATLYLRLDRAATALCPPAGRDVASVALAHKCQLSVLDETVGNVALPGLTALHRQRVGRTLERLASR